MASYVTTRGGRARIPRLVYGTAWKRERTADLVYQALQAGFRAIDTAAQPRHYREDLVAEGVRRALADGVVVSRSDLYIQTKFTPPSGQDLEGPNAPPYDPAAPIAEQVRASVESSLKHFTFRSRAGGGEDEPPYLDCLVLHSPLSRREDTVAVWTALQAFVPDRIRSVGISNVDLEDLQEVLAVAEELSPTGTATATSPIAPDLVPVVVQNRFHRHRHTNDPHDVVLRRFCAHPDRRIVYQSFWTLTANPDLLRSSSVRAVASGAQVSPEVALYGLVALGLGGEEQLHQKDGSSVSPCPVVILDGTTSPEHMAADLAGMDQVALWARDPQGHAVWKAAVAGFRQRIQDV